MRPSERSFHSFTDYVRQRPFRVRKQEMRAIEGKSATLIRLHHQADENIVPATEDIFIVCFLKADCHIRHNSGSGWRGYQAMSGDLVVNPPRAEVAFRADSPRKLLILSMPLDQLDKWVPYHPAIVETMLEPLYLERFRDRLVSDLVTRLWTESASGDHVSQLFFDGAVQSIVASLLRKVGGPSSANLTGASDPRLSRVIDYVESNLAKDLALPELAAIACLSTYHFARAFRSAFGRTPHAFVLDRRMTRAKNLLAKTTLPIAFIARDCGFASQSHMTTHFQRKYATTPRRYRQSQKS